MKKIGVAELKARLSENLRIVRGGGEVTVYDRQEPIARLIPFTVAGPLRVREPVKAYRTLGDVQLPKPAKLSVDAVELLLEERRRDE